MGVACSADGQDDLDAQPWYLCAEDTANEEPIAAYTPELQPRPSCLRNTPPPISEKMVDRLSPVKLSRRLGYRQDKLVQRLVLPTLALEGGVPVVNSVKMSRMLHRFEIRGHELGLHNQEVDDVIWDQHLVVTVKPDGVELGADEWRIDGVDDTGLLALWLMAQQLEDTLIVVSWRNRRRDCDSLASCSFLPGDPPQNQPNEELEPEAFAANILRAGWEWCSDWDLELEWGGHTGWRYAAEWTTEPDLWSKHDQRAATPLCRRKIFRVQMKRKDVDAGLLEVSHARKHLVLKLIDDIMDAKLPGFEELEDTVIDLHNKHESAHAAEAAKNNSTTGRSRVIFQRKIAFRSFEKGTAPAESVLDGTAACKLHSPVSRINSV